MNQITKRSFSNIKEFVNKNKLAKYYIYGYCLSMPLITIYYYYNTYTLTFPEELFYNKPYTKMYFKSVNSISDSL